MIRLSDCLPPVRSVSVFLMCFGLVPAAATLACSSSSTEESVPHSGGAAGSDAGSSGGTIAQGGGSGGDSTGGDSTGGDPTSSSGGNTAGTSGGGAGGSAGGSGPREGEAACKVGDEIYPSGATNVPDPVSCNTCECDDGQLICTEIDCPTACPRDRAPGTSCAQCGPADACEVVEHGCFEECDTHQSCRATGMCIDGVCVLLCG